MSRRQLGDIAARGGSVPRADDNGLGARLAGFRAISCDIFDTAIHRTLARPEDVLLAVGARAQARGLTACSAEAFREFRLAAEATVRREVEAAGHDEVRIAEVYARLAACGVLSDAPAGAALEFAVEQSVCRPIPAMRAALLAREPGQRLVFLSDTMLPGAWLARLLASCGYGADCEVISSADTRQSKHSGRLYARLLEQLGLPPAEILHIGDNPQADIANARRHGLATLDRPWNRPPPEAETVARTHVAVRLAHSLRRAPTFSPPPDPAPPLARYVSVLMLGFTLFILAEARRQGIDRIYFTARDGYLPLAIAKRITARTGEDLTLRYLEVSRQSIVLPGLGDDPAQLAELLGSTGRGRPLAAILEPLGIEPDRTAPLLAAVGIDPAQIADDKAGREAARRLTEVGDATLQAALRRRQEDARGYLEQVGFLAPGRRMVVDVGWRGSVQRQLARLAGLAEPDLFGCYLGLLPDAMRPEVSPRNAAGYLFAFGHPRPLMDIVLDGYILFELFFSAPHGSVAHYTAGESGFVAVHAKEQEPAAAARARFMAALERDCLAEIDALEAVLDGAWPDAIDPASALFDFAGLLRRPSRAEVARLSAIPFVHGADGRHLAAAVNPAPLHEVLLRPAATLRRFGRAAWRSGAVRASLPWPIPDMTYAELCHRYEQLRRLLGPLLPARTR